MLGLSAHLDTLYGGAAPEERLDLAARDGFGAVETWWVPDDPAGFVRRLRDLDLVLVSVNTSAGDGCGILSDPDADWRTDFARTLDFAREAGARHINALVGSRRPGLTRATQLSVARDNLAWALSQLEPDDPGLLVEPLNAADRPSPLVRCVPEAMDLLEGLDPRAGLLLDTYHASLEEPDVLLALVEATTRLRHVQIADTPTRGLPGSGTFSFAPLFTLLTDLGYDAWLGLEAFPDRLEPCWADDVRALLTVPA